jgi:hypothetical protein
VSALLVAAVAAPLRSLPDWKAAVVVESVWPGPQLLVTLTRSSLLWAFAPTETEAVNEPRKAVPESLVDQDQAVKALVVRWCRRGQQGGIIAQVIYTKPLL